MSPSAVATSTTSNQQFPLKQTAGAQANFNGFNQFRLFATGTKQLIATADLPALSPNSPSPASPSGAASPSSSPQGNNAQGVASVAGLLAAALLA